MKVVLDTNILLVSIAKKSPYRIIFDALLNSDYTLVISNDIIEEYAEIIEQKTTKIISSNIIKLLLKSKNVIKQDIYFKWVLIENDMEDNKFVDCAIAANADYIVTNDKHFNVLKSLKFLKVKVINIDDFINALNL